MAKTPSNQPHSVVPFPEPVAASGLPQRYELRQGEEQRYLRCRDAPNLEVTVDRALAFNETEARRLGERVILLDGVGQFPPLVDPDRQLYNLDHHEGCVRAFTLATCEQALVLVVQGLELERGVWKIYANEPDLDTVFALWVLLNHRRLVTMDAAARDRIAPLLRLEGAIDANGRRTADFCGLQQDTLRSAKRSLDELQAYEKSHKDLDGDPLGYTLGALAAIDRKVYRPGDFDEVPMVAKEYGHYDIGGDRVAVVCRDDEGIYEVEERLKAQWGDRLGLVALEKEPGHFTLRRSAALAGIQLSTAYARLNLEDPAVDGRPRNKKWGGSEEIGGSPRPHGSGLEPTRIGAILRRAFYRPTPGDRLTALGLAATTLPLFLLSLVAAKEVPWGFPAEWALAALFALALAAVAGRHYSGRRLWLFGVRLPSLDLPSFGLALVGAVAVLPMRWLGAADGASMPATLAALGLLAIAAEGAFRGVAHGIPMLHFGGHWPLLPRRLSPAVWWTSVLWTGTLLAAWALGLLGGWTGPAGALGEGISLGVSGLLSGLFLGLLRERTGSLWPGALALAAGWITAYLVDLPALLGL
ncbi:MAG: hypothetical protein AAF604_18300 [Acidobacteriota bacterium]